MATIFQRIRYTKNQCAILDFIEQNKTSITYSKSQVLDGLCRPFNTTHVLHAEKDGMDLFATLIKYHDTERYDNKSSYCFSRFNMLDGNSANQYPKSASEKDGFAHIVYSKMLNHYVAQHGLPR